MGHMIANIGQEVSSAFHNVLDDAEETFGYDGVEKDVHFELESLQPFLDLINPLDLQTMVPCHAELL